MRVGARTKAAPNPRLSIACAPINNTSGFSVLQPRSQGGEIFCGRLWFRYTLRHVFLSCAANVELQHSIGPCMSEYSWWQRLPMRRLGGSEVSRLSDDCRSCVVCMDDYKEGDQVVLRLGPHASFQPSWSQVRTLPCMHVFHQECIDEWLLRNRDCPICKTPVTSR